MNRAIPLTNGGRILLAVILLSVGGRSFADQVRVTDPDSLHQALKDAAAGDEVLLSSGDWRDTELLISATGTAEKPITVRAEEPGKVVISGNSRLRISGSHIVVSGLSFRHAWHKTALVEFRKDSKESAAHCRLTNCEIVDCNPPDAKTTCKYISIYGRQNRVDHCRFSGKTTGGTTLVVWLNESDPKHIIRRNYFGHRPLLGKNGGETIRIGDSETSLLEGGTLVEENLFEECDGEAEIVSNKSCGNVYRGNLFLRCSGALTLRHGNRCRVEGNLFLGEKARGTGGVRVIGKDHVVVNNYFERLEGNDSRTALCMMNGIEKSPLNGYDAVSGCVVAHNTFVDCKRTVLIGEDNEHKSQVAPADCLFANNLFISRRGPIIDLQTPPKGFKWLGNLCFGAGDLGVEVSDGLQRCDTDPLQKMSHRWSIFAESPAVGRGERFEKSPQQDLAGRPRDAQPDVGCDEWVSSVGDLRILLASDVGPSW